MNKIAYIEEIAYKLLIKRLNLPQLTVLEKITLHEPNIVVYKVKTKQNTLNTTLNRYIHSTSDGNYYIGNTTNKNRVRLTKVLKALWNINDPLELRKLKTKWDSCFISKIQVGLPTVIYNTEHCKNGTIGRSCMIGRGEYYELFEKNGLKVAYVKQENKITGRALVWETNNKMRVEVWDRKKRTWITIKGFVDRIYYKDESILEAIRKWAFKQKYWVRIKQDFNSAFDFIDENGKHRINKYIQVRFTDFRIKDDENWYEKIKWPSMDTLKFLIIEKYNQEYSLLLKNAPLTHRDKYSHIMLRLENTKGSWSSIFYRCQNCSIWVDKVHKIKKGEKIIQICDDCRNNKSIVYF